MSNIYSLLIGEGGGDLTFFSYSCPFCFVLNEFHSTFSISCKIIPYCIY